MRLFLLALIAVGLAAPSSVRADNPDQLFVKVRAIVRDPNLDDAAAADQLKNLRDETGDSEIIRYGEGVLAARRKNWKGVVEYFDHFPLDASYGVRADWELAAAAFNRRDFETFESAIGRLCVKIKKQHDAPRRDEDVLLILQNLQRIDRNLQWRDCESAAVKRLLESLATIRDLPSGASPGHDFLSLEEFWPATEPFTVEAFQAAIAREKKRLEVERQEREQDPELQRIRAIKDEQKYQVEIQNYSERNRSRRGFVVAILENIRADVEKELSAPGDLRELVVPLRLSSSIPKIELPSVERNGFQTLVEAGVSDAVARSWLITLLPFSAYIGDLNETDRAALAERCRQGMRADFSQAEKQGTATMRLRISFMLGALLLGDLEFVRQLDQGAELPAAEDYTVGIIQVLAALETGKLDSLPERIARYVRLLPDDSTPTDKELWPQRSMLVYLRDSLDAKHPELAKQLHAKLDEGLEKVRLNLQDSPQQHGLQLHYLRTGENGRVIDLPEKRSRIQFVREKYLNSLWQHLSMNRPK